MPQMNFAIDIDNGAFQNAASRAQREGKSIESILAEFVANYAGPVSAGSPVSSGQTVTYTIQRGDTLSKIAARFYGDSSQYRLIQQANNIANPSVIYVGQSLVIPNVTGTSPAPATPTPVVSQPAPASPSPAPTTPPSIAAPQPTPPVSPAPQPQPQPAAPTGDVNPSFLNGDFDTFQPYLRDGQPLVWKEDRFPEEYGQHWKLKVLDQGKGRLHLMSSAVFGRFAQAYFGGGGLNYAYGGGNSQVIASRYDYDIVFRQRIAAQAGKKYRFGGLIVSFYKGTDNPATPNKIFKTLGIDPTGGDDPKSQTVIWGERDSTDHAWLNPSIEAVAKANAITVFVRIENKERDVGETELNLVHLDKFTFEAV